MGYASRPKSGRFGFVERGEDCHRSRKPNPKVHSPATNARGLTTRGVISGTAPVPTPRSEKLATARSINPVATGESRRIAPIPVQQGIPTPNGFVTLTARENEVMEQLAQGLFYKEIAGNLGIAVNTVNQHLNHIYAKLGAANKVEALNSWHHSERAIETNRT